MLHPGDAPSFPSGMLQAPVPIISRSNLVSNRGNVDLTHVHDFEWIEKGGGVWQGLGEGEKRDQNSYIKTKQITIATTTKNPQLV